MPVRFGTPPFVQTITQPGGLGPSLARRPGVRSIVRGPTVVKVPAVEQGLRTVAVRLAARQPLRRREPRSFLSGIIVPALIAFPADGGRLNLASSTSTDAPVADTSLTRAQRIRMSGIG